MGPIRFLKIWPRAIAFMFSSRNAEGFLFAKFLNWKVNNSLLKNSVLRLSDCWKGSPGFIWSISGTRLVNSHKAASVDSENNWSVPSCNSASCRAGRWLGVGLISRGVLATQGSGLHPHKTKQITNKETCSIGKLHACPGLFSFSVVGGRGSPGGSSFHFHSGFKLPSLAEPH